MSFSRYLSAVDHIDHYKMSVSTKFVTLQVKVSWLCRKSALSDATVVEINLIKVPSTVTQCGGIYDKVT